MGPGQVRPSVAAMAAYRPGKGAKQAEAEHGISGAIKLASNENPFPPPPSVVAAMEAAAAGVNRYPDHGARELRAKIADWVGSESERITIGCGSSGLLQQLCLAYVEPGDEVIYPWLSFEAYPVFVRMMAGTEVRVPLVDDAFDLDAVVAAVTDRTRLICLATPNNPTGTTITRAQIEKVLQQVPPSVLVVVDEAYREFSDPALGDPALLCPDYDNLVVLRTFSKAYGLAAVRIGYAVAHPHVITEIDKVLLAFAVNAIAQAGAMAAIDAIDEIEPVLSALVAERDRVVAALRESGWDLPDPQANFVWLPVGDRTDDLALALEQRGVVIRPFSGFGIRVTIGTAEENDRFLTTFAEVNST